METPAHVVQVLQGEVERLTQYLQTLPPDAWPHPSACDLWEVRDVVGHLTWVAERFHGTISHAVRGDIAPPAGSPPVGTSTRAGRNAFVAREAIALRERLGDQLLTTFRARVDRLMALLTHLGPQEWAQPAYSALRVVPLWHYPSLTLARVRAARLGYPLAAGTGGPAVPGERGRPRAAAPPATGVGRTRRRSLGSRR